MDVDKLQKVIARVKNVSDRSKLNEEQTKTYLIMPLFDSLGYDVFNIDEFVPEFTADFTKKGERVDYAICINGQPVVLVEAKKIGVGLDAEHITQLSRYYSCTDAKIGILTNGDEYWFFADSVKNNIMDREPYMKISLSKDTDAAERLEVYSRGKIEEYDILSDVRYNRFELVTQDFIDKLYNGNIPTSFMDYLAVQAEVEDLDRSRLATIFFSRLKERFGIVDTIINVKENLADNADKEVEAEKKKKGKWDKSKMDVIEPGKVYVYNEVKWQFHKLSKLIIYEEETEVTSIKEAVALLVKLMLSRYGSVDELLEVTKKTPGFALLKLSKDKDSIDRMAFNIEGTELWATSQLQMQYVSRLIKNIIDLLNMEDTDIKVVFAS